MGAREAPPADMAALAAVLGAAMRAAGLPGGTGRSERLARALTVMGASTVADVHACALATLVSDPGHIETFERVFAGLFGVLDPAARPRDDDGDPGAMPADPGPGQDTAGQDGGDGGPTLPRTAGTEDPAGQHEDAGEPEVPAARRLASAAERLASRDFAGLSPDELRQLAALMRQLTIAVPRRRTRRYQPSRMGSRPDLRRTLRHARRTGGEPVALARSAERVRPRRLVVLCDISGSMEPYARALLQFMYCASRGASGTRSRTEVFTFATRLTRLTKALSAASPQTLLAKAAEAAPDWSGGTRIGAALREFNDRYGSRGMARGAVVLIISDGWETGDPALLGEQMARLSRIAYRIVWANPRTQSPRYRPEVGGMAAAWPYCDAVVSAHSLNAVDDLLLALSR